jgi:isoquinoline 1-oxidoreductase alpha subunit
MASSEITVNGETRTIDADPQMPLLWILRDVLRLTGTKYGCGRGLCGACTVHVDGRAMRACLLTVASLDGRAVTTIEGLGDGHAGGLHPVQSAWIEADVPQCGFCQAGQVMQAVSLLSLNGSPTREEVDRAMAGNLCRCGTYTRVRKAIAIAIANAVQRREENP